MVAKADEQHLDADVEVGQVPQDMESRILRQTQRPKQMNSSVQSKTEVFEKIEESLRPLCMAEDLNDDEIMELCILSNELNACETTAMLKSVKVCGHVQRGWDSVKGLQWI